MAKGNSRFCAHCLATELADIPEAGHFAYMIRKTAGGQPRHKIVKILTAYQCRFCGYIHQIEFGDGVIDMKCLDEPRIPIELTPAQYCDEFGHEMRGCKIEGTRRFEYWDLELGNDSFGHPVYSNEYALKCERCGYTKTERRP